jgi:hypothetical protein
MQASTLHHIFILACSFLVQPQVDMSSLNIAPIKRLQSAVVRCTQHFAQPVSGTAKANLGNDNANREIGRLVRGELCTSLAMVFLNGFKSFKFVGRFVY